MPQQPTYELSRFRYLTRILLAPALLSIIALNQIQMVRQSELTPWKGGGFGMFCTVNGPFQRIVKIWVETDSGFHPVEVPDKLSQLKKRLVASPTEFRARSLARQVDLHLRERIASLEKGTTTVADVSPAKSKFSDELDLDGESTTTSSEYRQHQAQSFISKYRGVKSIRVEISYLNYDRNEKQLFVTRKLEVVVPAAFENSKTSLVAER